MVAELNEAETPESAIGTYSAGRAAALKQRSFDREALGRRGYAYERLDQLTIDVLLGVR
jgi:xylose isomerase